MENLKKTVLGEVYKEYGGKIIDFAGWALPVEFKGILEEHKKVREEAGLFDVSHMGEVLVKGKEAEDFIQYLITNDIKLIDDNGVVYTFMCYENGGVVDDLLVYKFSKEEYFLVVNASNVEKDFNWIKNNGAKFNVEVENISHRISQLALQGPKAEEILQKLTKEDLKEIKFFKFKRNVVIQGIECLVSRTGYTGEDGFEIYMANDGLVALWRKILESGMKDGVCPVGLGARDTLRFEACLPLYGNEISENITPLEAGFGFFVKLNKEDFIGKKALKEQKEEGLKKKLIGFEMIGRGIPRHGYEVIKEGQAIGVVTTGYFSPTLEKNIGLALIDSKYAELHNSIYIKIRNKEVEAEIISKRFYDKKTKNK